MGLIPPCLFSDLQVKRSRMAVKLDWTLCTGKGGSGDVGMRKFLHLCFGPVRGVYQNVSQVAIASMCIYRWRWEDEITHQPGITIYFVFVHLIQNCGSPRRLSKTVSPISNWPSRASRKIKKKQLHVHGKKASNHV